MQMESDATPIDSKAIAIPIQLDDIELYSARPFSELIEEDHAADKPYLFARIDTEDTPDKKERRQYSHYVDAAQLNKQLVQNTHPYFQPSESVKHPTNRLLIKNVVYYMITKESKETCTQVCTYDAFYPVARWNTLFRHNQLSVNANNNNPTLASPPANAAPIIGILDGVEAVPQEALLPSTRSQALRAVMTSYSSTQPHTDALRVPAAYLYADTHRAEITGITAAPSGNVQETAPLMGNQTLRNHLKDCLTRAENCCFNQSLHDCCRGFGTCVGVSTIALLGTAVAAILCGIDTALLPFACLVRPCKYRTNPSRNDVFYFCIRSEAHTWLDIKTCYGIDITTSKKECVDTYCDCSPGPQQPRNNNDNSDQS